METVNLENHDVIACVPIYKEPLHELNKMISSFKKDRSNLKYYLFIIVDGVDDGVKSLLHLLNTPHADFNEHASFKYLTGKLNNTSRSANYKIDYMLIVKNQNRGKHDTQILFLNLLEKFMKGNHRAFLRPISLLMLDSDTGFRSDAVKILHESLWESKNHNVAAVTGQIYTRYCFLNLLQCAQSYEYKLFNLLLKVSESKYGLVNCVPGSFCLYKMKDVVNQKIINQYASSPKNALHAHNILGEDRYLTVILLRSGLRTMFNLKSTAYTSVPDSVQSFLLQRRRWNNSILTSLSEIITRRFEIDKSKSTFESYSKLFKIFIFKTLIALQLLFIILYPANWAQLMWQFSFQKVCHFPPINLSIVLLFSAGMVLLALISSLYDVSKHPNIWKVIVTGSSMVSFFFLVSALYGIILYLSGYPYIHYTLDQLTILLGFFSLTCLPLLRYRQFHLIDVYCWICRFILTPVIYIVAVIYAYSHFDNFTWGTRNLNDKMKHLQSQMSQSAVHYKRALLIFVIGLNAGYLSIGALASPQILNWIFITHTFAAFFPALIGSLFFNYQRRKSKAN